MQAIVSTTEGQALQLQPRGYSRPARATVEPTGDNEDDVSIADHLFRVLRGTHNLAFANCRIDVELFADLLRQRCAALRVPNEFWPHHGNLSRDLRQDVEAMLKDRSKPATAICTRPAEEGSGFRVKRQAQAPGQVPVRRRPFRRYRSTLRCTIIRSMEAPMSTVTVSPKFQVVIPREIREAMKLKAGARIQVFQFRNRLELVPVRKVASMRGFLKGIDTAVEREPDRV